MAKRMSRRQQRKQDENRAALKKLLLAIVLLAIPVAFFAKAMLGKVDLDDETACPPEPSEYNVLLVDVTDPMNLPQRQDFSNQFERLIGGVARYGQIEIIKVDPVSDRLLAPIISRCNPGRREDVSSTDGNPNKVAKQHEELFADPLDASFDQIVQASGAERSPILESVQSVALTQLQNPGKEGMPKKLIIASDLLQNTDQISFYNGVPDVQAFIDSPEFRRVRTDLRGVKVELWMLERSDADQTQPRALADLWQAIIESEGGEITRVYRVSG